MIFYPTFYGKLASILTFSLPYLASFQAFILAFVLTFSLTFSLTFLSGILSGIYSDILCVILFILSSDIDIHSLFFLASGGEYRDLELAVEVQRRRRRRRRIQQNCCYNLYSYLIYNHNMRMHHFVPYTCMLIKLRIQF